MSYKITPGLYAVGSPDADSPVLVSANYKMSFDYLRKELVDIDAWILVLDTKGINVWCAAGKGTFGTEEIIRQIKNTNLKRVVNHHLLIVPQLGAPGVAAHLVKKATGFKVIYGPVKASDLPAFFKARLKADTDMRRVRFNIVDRLVLTPMEFVLGLKYIASLCAIFFLLSGLDRTGYSVDSLLTYGPKSVLLLLVAYFSGTIITPLLLPFIPGRAFALKGFISGLAVSFLAFFYFSGFADLGIIDITAWFLIISSISSFFAMNFTGASTYTSLSGVKKEMHIALPLQIIGLIAGFILSITGRFLQ
ncbi:MAG TPA: acetyl-CoA synthase subunit gamma [bacterium]|nr:acetyl-CoA synthase subunit gamma [bacterium]